MISNNYNVTCGNLIDIVGTLTTVDGERVVQEDTDGVTITESGCALPRPVGMNNRAVGGGALGPFTTAIGSSSGPNNTGMLATTWGAVTESYIWAADGSIYSCIDDGSGIDAGNGYIGVRYYIMDMFDPGTCLTATGIIGSKLSGSTNVPVIYLVYATYPSYSTGSGTISGTVTAGTSAANATAWVHWTGGTTKCTLNAAGVGIYSITAKPGDHTVSVDVAGYTHAAEKATVAANQTTTKNFTLTSIGKDIYVYPTAPRIPPDGASTTSVTAIVYDEEGRRLPNQAVTWSHDLGTVISADAMTNAIGEATLVLRAPTSNGTATISATAGSATSQCFREFATADAPSVRITQPTNGTTVSGNVYIVTRAGDSEGLSPGVMFISVFVDGIELDRAPDSFCESWLMSGRLPNGSHQITATARDWDGNVSNSNAVNITTQNDIASFTLTPSTVMPNQPVHISGQVTVAPGWTVTVTDPCNNNQLIWSTSGTGSTISVDWPGTSQGGIYTVTATATATGNTTSDAAVNDTVTHPQFLIVNAYLPSNSSVISKVADVAKRRNLTYRILEGNQATWENIQTALSGSTCRYLFICTHCQWSGIGGNITRLLLGDNSQLYARAFLRPNPEDPEHPIPVNEGDNDPNNTGHMVHYVSSISRNWDTDPLKFVWCNGCHSGRNGATLRVLDGSHGNQTGQYATYSCYQIDTWNDMATALGITPLRAQESGLGYVGWYTGPVNGPAMYGDDSVNGIIIDTFSQLAAGTSNAFSFEFARNWIWNHRSTYRYDDVIWQDPNSLSGESREIAPYYNWRFYGKNNCVFF